MVMQSLLTTRPLSFTTMYPSGDTIYDEERGVCMYEDVQVKQLSSGTCTVAQHDSRSDYEFNYFALVIFGVDFEFMVRKTTAVNTGLSSTYRDEQIYFKSRFGWCLLSENTLALDEIGSFLKFILFSKKRSAAFSVFEMQPNCLVDNAYSAAVMASENQRETVTAQCLCSGNLLRSLQSLVA